MNNKKLEFDFQTSSKTSKNIWVNNQLVSWDDCMIHMTTHSLHYAGSVFEGIRAYNGKIFKLIEHVQRLLRSADLMNLKINYSAQDIMQATKNIININNLQNAYIRIIIWRGAKSLKLCDTDLPINIMIMAQESNPVLRSNMSLYVSPWRVMPTNVLPNQSKTSAIYSMNMISQNLAKQMGFDDALLLDQYDDIAECTTTNIFFGKQDINNNIVLVTPIADRFLNGITRQTVIEIARTLNMKVYETRLSLDDLEEQQYSNCFVTGTSGEVRGIASINHDSLTKSQYRFNDCKITQRIQNEYIKIVGK